MKARFSTKCSVCDAFIEKGKEIVKNEDEIGYTNIVWMKY